MKRYVLDACALVAFFNDEEGADLVTAEHHELNAVDEVGEIEFLWVR